MIHESKATLILTSSLGIALVLLCISVLWATVDGSRDPSETTTRILTVVVTLVAGVLGYEAGRRAKDHTTS